MSRREVPSAAAAMWTIARVTVRRLSRRRALWVCGAIALLPVAFAIVMQSNGGHHFEDMFAIDVLVLAILPPAFVASSIGEEIEDRTTTYLWSRPLPRWSLLIGKLVGLAPIAIVFVVGGWWIAIRILNQQSPRPDAMIALSAAVLAVSAISAGISALVPKHGMALTIVYMLFFDLPIGEIPASIQIASVTHQAQLIAHVHAEGSASSGAIAMAIVAGLWLGVGLWRVQRLES